MTRGFRDEDRERSEDVAIDNVRATRATDKALLCMIDGEEKWVPQSCITDDSEVYAAGDEGRLVITAWFARKEGLV